MTAHEQIQLSLELSMARVQIDEAKKGLTHFAELGAIIADPKLPLAYRARFFLIQADALISQIQDSGWAPEAPPTLDDHIALAQKQLGRASVPTSPNQLSSSPSENQNMGSADAPEDESNKNNGSSVTHPRRVGAPSAQDNSEVSAQ